MNQSKIYQNPAYLKETQYKDSSNLDARAELHRRFSTAVFNWHEWAFEQLNIQPNSRILECGCGPGWLWRENLERIPAGCSITLTDLSAGMVAEAESAITEAEAALADSDHDFTFKIANIEELPFADGEFDIIVGNHMLYHVPDLDKGLGEVRRVLAENGRFHTATNGATHMQELRALRDMAQTVRWNLSFRLENGRELLAPHFNDIRLDLFEDSLEVTEVEPLMNYILSMKQADSADWEEGVRQARQEVERVIGENGRFHITKSSGLFSALK